MLRQAKQSDIKEIKQLIDYASKINKVLSRPTKDLKENIKNFYVYLEKARIIGCCSLEVYSKKLAEIRSLVVSPSKQRKGIGKSLVLACLKRAKKLKIYEVLSITDQIKFFKKVGFSGVLHNQMAMMLKL